MCDCDTPHPKRWKMKCFVIECRGINKPIQMGKIESMTKWNFVSILHGPKILGKTHYYGKLSKLHLYLIVVVDVVAAFFLPFNFYCDEMNSVFIHFRCRCWKNKRTHKTTFLLTEVIFQINEKFFQLHSTRFVRSFFFFFRFLCFFIRRFCCCSSNKTYFISLFERFIQYRGLIVLWYNIRFVKVAHNKSVFHLTFQFTVELGSKKKRDGKREARKKW